MINLLPEYDKREIKAGITNRLLVRYLSMFLGLAVFMMLALVAVYFYLSNTKVAAEDNIARNQADSLELTAKQKEVNDFKSDLATAKQILDKQVNYSTIILRFASTIPSGVVVDNLALDPETIDQPTKINARTKTEQAAINLKNALNRSPYFDDAYFDTITRTEDDDYPYTVTMSVTFTQELLDE